MICITSRDETHFLQKHTSTRIDPMATHLSLAVPDTNLNSPGFASHERSAVAAFAVSPPPQTVASTRASPSSNRFLQALVQQHKLATFLHRTAPRSTPQSPIDDAFRAATTADTSTPTVDILAPVADPSAVDTIPLPTRTSSPVHHRSSTDRASAEPHASTSTVHTPSPIIDPCAVTPIMIDAIPVPAPTLLSSPSPHRVSSDRTLADARASTRMLPPSPTNGSTLRLDVFPVRRRLLAVRVDWSHSLFKRVYPLVKVCV